MESSALSGDGENLNQDATPPEGQSEELVRLLLNSTGEGIYGIDSNGNCTFANPAYCRVSA